jgi:hypothetical protein
MFMKQAQIVREALLKSKNEQLQARNFGNFDSIQTLHLGHLFQLTFRIFAGSSQEQERAASGTPESNERNSWVSTNFCEQGAFQRWHRK